MVFYVVVLKTDTPNKPFAIHQTKLKAKYRQKQIFKMFTRQFAENPKEYYAVSLEKNGEPRMFYVKKKALATVRKLAQEHNYYVKLPKDTWGTYVEPVKPPRKKPANKQFMVEPIPTLDLRAFVLESIADYSPVDVAARLMFQRGIPVFSTNTRKLGVRTLFKNCGCMRSILMEENFARMDQKKAAVNEKNRQPYDTYVPPGRKYDYGLSGSWGTSDNLIDWNVSWYDDKKRVDRVCGVLTKLYSETPGSRKHTQDAIPFKANEHQYQIKVI